VVGEEHADLVGVTFEVGELAHPVRAPSPADRRASGQSAGRRLAITLGTAPVLSLWG
jgi:hypothetical protein